MKIKVYLILIILLVSFASAITKQTALTGGGVINSVAEKQLVKTATISSLREAVEEFIRAWHMDGDAIRALSFVSTNSPLLSPRENDTAIDFFSTTDGEWRAKKFVAPRASDTNNAVCSNDISADKFCAVMIRDLKLTGGERANLIVKLILAGINEVPFLDTMSFVLYSFEFDSNLGDWTGKVTMVTLWVKETNGWKLFHILEVGL